VAGLNQWLADRTLVGARGGRELPAPQKRLVVHRFDVPRPAPRG
jgi:hypothetical protein